MRTSQSRMASPARSVFPSVLKNVPAAADSNSGNRRPPTEEGAASGGSSPADAAVARSTDSHFVPRVAPAYAPAPTANTSATATTTSPSGIRDLRPALHPSMATGRGSLNPVPLRRGSSRASSAVGEAASSLERRAIEAPEMTNQLKVAAVEQEVSQVARELDDVQRAIRNGGSYRGKEGRALVMEEQRLARKEGLLRENEVQLRKEGNTLLRLRFDQQRRRSSVAARPKKRLSFISAQGFPDDPEEQEAEQQRVAQIEDMIARRESISNGGDSGRQSVSTGGPEGFVDGGEPEGLESDDGEPEGDMPDGYPDHSKVMVQFKTGLDRRLMLKMQAFNQPVLVGTLLSGFTLVLFDVATKDLARRLAVLAFALEISSSTVLSLIMFRGQQLYSQTTYIKENKNQAKSFLKTMWIATRLSLVLFSLGVVALFVVSFVVEASDEMGGLWLALFSLILCPTAIAAILFPASTEQLKHRAAPYKSEPAPANVGD